MIRKDFLIGVKRLSLSKVYSRTDENVVSAIDIFSDIDNKLDACLISYGIFLLLVVFISTKDYDIVL